MPREAEVEYIAEEDSLVKILVEAAEIKLMAAAASLEVVFADVEASELIVAETVTHFQSRKAFRAGIPDVSRVCTLIKFFSVFV